MSLALWMLSSVALALTAGERTVLDRAIAQAKASSQSGIYGALQTRSMDVERRLRESIDSLQQSSPSLQQRLAQTQESVKLLENSDINVYNDARWRDYLLKSVTAYCCRQYEAGFLSAQAATEAPRPPVASDVDERRKQRMEEREKRRRRLEEKQPR